MSDANTRTAVIDYIQKNGNAGDGIKSDEQDLIAEGIIDSFGLLGLIGFIEDELGCRIDASQVDPSNFNTVAKIVATISRQRH